MPCFEGNSPVPVREKKLSAASVRVRPLINLDNKSEVRTKEGRETRREGSAAVCRYHCEERPNEAENSHGREKYLIQGRPVKLKNMQILCSFVRSGN